MGKLEKAWGYLFQFLRMICMIIMNVRNILKTKRNLKQENMEKVLIIANGPSLQKIDIDRVKKDSTRIICVNFFPCKDRRFFLMKPEYLCLFDPLYFDVDSQPDKEQFEELYRCLERVDWKLQIVCEWGKKSLPVKNDNISYIRVSNILYQADLFQRFLYSHNLAHPGVQNVVLGAIFFAVNAGAEKIYIAGVDNSEFMHYQIDENNNVYLKTEHCYGSGSRERCVDIIRGEFYKRLQQYCKMFEQYFLLGKYINKYTKSKVINLNPDSYVDVFDKTSEYYM